MEMTITRGLSELKLLDKRIKDEISSAIFITENKKSSDKVLKTFTKEEFNNKAQASFQSVLDKMKRRNYMKSAIVQSNATTMVVIGGKTMTVAEAIERKTSIEYDKYLLNELERQYRGAVSKMNLQNQKVQSTLDDLMKVFTGKDSSKDISVESTKMTKEYLENNEYELVDPIKILDKIETMRKEIDEFEHEVDFVLSESNTITKIFIED